MGKTKHSFNAISAVMDIARALEHSHTEVVGLYSDEMKRIKSNGDERHKLDSENEKLQLMDQIQKLSKFLKTNPLETLLFVSIYSVQIIRSCNVRHLAGFIGISTIDFIPLRNSVVGLLQKGLILEEIHHSGNVYIVSNAAEHALLENEPIKKKKSSKLDPYAFCEIISSLIEDRSQYNIDTEELFNLVNLEEDRQNNLPLVNELRKLLPRIDSRTLFYEICDNYTRDSRNCNTGVEFTIGEIYDDIRKKSRVVQSIMNKKHPLIVSGLVELLPTLSPGEAELALTAKGKHLLQGDDCDMCRAKGDSRLISPDKIPVRELFFSEKLAQDIDLLKRIFQEENFVKMQKRMGENTLSKSMVVLFHGLPGTGKTAAVDMIAKTTGRSIYHVDIAASKSSWFGESEKLFKKIFTDYRHMCETEERKPILLFNEADALFSKRRNVDLGNCAQIENTLQNILLEEMEAFDGILIATTNMRDNFDTAFERRFLFKIKFDQPDTAAKQRIWKNKMAWLSEEDCNQLAKKFDLSGGEIDNIVRKAMMEEVLNGTHPTFDMLEAWCRGEKLTRKGENAIGFAC